MLSPQFLEIFQKALQRGTEVTLDGLLRTLGDQENNVLDRVQSVRNTITACGLELIPDTLEGDLNTIRVLRATKGKAIDAEYMVEEIGLGETTNSELKSSLIYDHKRALAEPDTPIAKLKSEDVTLECLKTIAAFLNSDGGILYVGANNDGDCVGIEQDFLFFKQGHGDKDAWELHLRNLVSTRFKEGNNVNNYIGMEFATVEGKTLARICVQKRNKLSFLKKEQNYVLFCRQGNRTIEVKIDEIEELLVFRSRGTE